MSTDISSHLADTSTHAPLLSPPADQLVSVVLLVDDQVIVGETVRRMLADSADIDFHYCGNPTEALGLVELIKPTVILQDLVMPGIDGLTLVPRYRANPATRDIPVIVLSVKEDASIKRDAFTAGASDYLVKLPDKIELIARIRMHSSAYLHQRQRNEAYLALRESQRQLLSSNAALQAMNEKLSEALSKVKQLSGLLPICAYCKRIRSDQNYWEQVDHYVVQHSDVQFSHGICPTCYEKVTGDLPTEPGGLTPG